MSADPDLWAESCAAWRRVRSMLRPPPKLTISEWADRHRVLGPSSPTPGPWRTDVAPFLREIQDSLGPDSGKRLSAKEPAQHDSKKGSLLFVQEPRLQTFCSSDVGSVVPSLGSRPSKQRSARCCCDDRGTSYEPDLLFVVVCFGIGC